MAGQTRYILNKYKENGGEYQEFVFENGGHGLHVEFPEKFNRKLIPFIKDVK